VIIELAGLPRSGKSSAIEVARDYFGRGGVSVRTIAEGARTCPFDRKHRIELSNWTANMALTNVLESKLNLSSNILVLQDRGLFDSIAFLKMLHLENFINQKTFSDFENYFTNRNWTQLVDLVILLQVKPSIAIERDLAARISSNPAFITNLQSLSILQESYNYVIKKHKTKFPSIVMIDTSKMNRLEVATSVINLVSQKSTFTPTNVNQE